VTVFPKSILTERAIEIARFTLFQGLGALLVVVAVVFVVLRQQIAVPLKQLTSATNRIAEGDFNISLEDTRQDELGRLAHSFNMMIKEVEARTIALQSALEQQAISVYQTTTTMDELRASSRQSAQQAEVAAAGAKEVLILAEAGTLAVGHALEDMAILKEKVEAIAQEILRLSDGASQIGNISGLVSDLANQTNMLSLNAAVEAARGGQNGKGFAVVAGEIRKLADQSKKSATKINALITDIQSAIKATVMVTAEATKKVEQGVKTAQGNAETFTSVTDAINSVVTSSQQISLMAKQQAIAIQQVVDAMNALNQQVGQTASGISQTKVGV
jgi:methyl-accepting chemotaxis protein